MVVTKNDEMKMLVKDAECGICGADMIRIDDPDRDGGLQVARCKADPEHRGYKLTQTGLSRQAEPPWMSKALEARSPILAGYNVQVIINRLLKKWPSLDVPQAAMFISQCEVLGLDPFMGEIAALAFKDNKTGGVTMAPMITGKGWALLAAKTEPNEFLGPPELRPITDAAELKVRRAEDDDIVIAASGTKRSWGEHRTTVVSMLRASEWKTSKIEAVKEDPYHHAETRAERRWYEKNYPAAAAIERESTQAEPREELRLIIEGEYKVLPDGGAIAGLSNAHAWLTTCPEHNVDWFQSAKMREPAHKVGKEWCNLTPVINKRAGETFKAAVEQLGWTKDETAIWLRENYQGSWSKLDPAAMINAMEAAAALVVAKLAEDEAGSDPPQEATEQAQPATPEPATASATTEVDPRGPAGVPQSRAAAQAAADADPTTGGLFPPPEDG